MSGFDDLGDGVRKIFLAGVGAVALGAEKSQEVVSDLVKKGLTQIGRASCRERV